MWPFNRSKTDKKDFSNLWNPTQVPSVAVALAYNGQEWSKLLPLIRTALLIAEAARRSFFITVFSDTEELIRTALDAGGRGQRAELSRKILEGLTLMENSEHNDRKLARLAVVETFGHFPISLLSYGEFLFLHEQRQRLGISDNEWQHLLMVREIYKDVGRKILSLVLILPSKLMTWERTNRLAGYWPFEVINLDPDNGESNGIRSQHSAPSPIRRFFESCPYDMVLRQNTALYEAMRICVETVPFLASVDYIYLVHGDIVEDEMTSDAILENISIIAAKSSGSVLRRRGYSLIALAPPS